MPRPEISALHHRLRRTAMGLDRRNYPRDQMRAISELERMEQPKWRRRNAKLPSPERVAWYARTLAELVVAGSRSFIDPGVAEMAWNRLVTLTDPVAHEAIRQVWLEAPDGKLSELVTDRLPTDVHQRAVTLYLLGDLGRYTAVDPSGALLESARAEGDPGLRVQLAAAARRGKQLGWAYRVAAVPERLLPEEWEALIELLRDGNRQQYLWQLLDRAPLAWAARCLVELADWPQVDQTLVQLATEYLEGPLELLNPDQPSAVAVSPDGTLAATSRRGLVRIRRHPTGRTLAYLPRTVTGITDVHTLLIPPAGDLLIVHGRTKQNEWRTIVARLPSGTPIAALTAAGPAPVITPDGQYVAVVEPDGLGLWRLPGCTRLEPHRANLPNATLLIGTAPDGTPAVLRPSPQSPLAAALRKTSRPFDS